MDQENALIVSQETLSEYFGISKRPIISQLNVLKEKVLLKLLNQVQQMYTFVNANIAWTSYANKREYAQFKANVFVSKSEQEYKIKSSKFKQLDLLDKGENE